MKGVCTWNGSLSAADFYASAIYFSQKWKEINLDFPDWIWVPCNRLGAVSEVSHPTIISFGPCLNYFLRITN
jgi:hypothetical protein